MFAKRIRILSLICSGALLAVWARVVHLQVGLGPLQRAVASATEVRVRPIPAVRGTIRARDGTVLALDRSNARLAVHYRYLERPLNELWLAQQLRVQLPRSQRRDPERLAQANSQLRQEIQSMWRNLAELTGTSIAELDRRAGRIQHRVQRIADTVNRRRRENWARHNGPVHPSADATHSIWQNLTRWLGDTTPPPPEPKPLSVVEQYRYYPLIDNVSLQTILEFTAHPELYPGVRMEQQLRRVYPLGTVAGSVVGYVEPWTQERAWSGAQSGAWSRWADEPLPHMLHSGVGSSGLEGFYDAQLRGEPGRVRELLRSESGPPRILGGRPPKPGTDITLTLDLELQNYAEELLGEHQEKTVRFTSGAVLVMDARTGAVLSAAVVPKFDLNVASRPNSQAARELNTRPDAPLYNRLVQMSLPPGSTFKPVTAIASLTSHHDPAQEMFCRGYLHTPDRHRCMIFRHYGVGHGAVSLTEAIAQSCNVYFFRIAERLGSRPIRRWAYELAFGRKTGIDLARESPGFLPSEDGSESSRREPGRFPDHLGIAIGQGDLCATPIQVAVMMAAVANGGNRVVPHLRRDAFQPPVPIQGLSGQVLALVREGLKRGIADERGTGHRTVYLRELAIAGKTGTAQSGSPRGDHAWFAGYVPHERPRLVLVIALEHGGSAGRATGPLVRALIRKMLDLGYFPRAVASGRNPQSEPR